MVSLFPCFHRTSSSLIHIILEKHDRMIVTFATSQTTNSNRKKSKAVNLNSKKWGGH